MNRARVQSCRLVDIAKAAKVSRTVAGRVLLGSGSNVRVSVATAERVRQIARKLNYRPNQVARQLKGIRSNLLGVLLSSSQDALMWKSLLAMNEAAHEQGYRLILGRLHHDEPTNLQIKNLTQYMDDFRGRGIEAILCLTNIEQTLAQPLADCPVVIHLNRPPIPNAWYVETDRAMVSRLAVRRLFDIGKQRIGALLVNSSRHLTQQRILGYKEELTALKISFDPNWLWVPKAPAPPADQAGPLIEQALNHLVDQHHVDGITVCNDEYAALILRSLKRRGLRVPADVAVIGYNNLPMTELLDPALTTIDPNHPGISKAMLAMAEQALREGSLPTSKQTALIEPHLIVRDSA